MKKQLLTALVALTPFFAFSNEEVSKTELLAHLKTTKKDAEHMSQGLKIAAKEMQKKCAFGKDYLFFLDMMNEIDQQLNHSLQNKLLGELSNNAIELICNEMKTIDDINDIVNDNAELLLDSGFLGFTNDNEKEFTIIASIFAQHHKKYCIENPHNDLMEMHFMDLCDSDALAPFFVNMGIEFFNELSKKIDTKIKELQKA